MDLIKAVEELREHKKQLDQAIATLEALDDGLPTKVPSRRGRKDMAQDERTRVSERMRNYWAKWREQHANSTGNGKEG